MANLNLILLVFSFVLFFIACWPAAGPYWNRLIAAGLTFFVAAELFGGISHFIH
jgi:Na+-translocating ferredoxin:NAD+ oxidoreductase RnfD subunit